MKSSFLFLFVFLFSLNTSFSQSIDKDWYGKLDAGMVKIPLVFHIKTVKKGKYQGTMDSPSQKAFGIELSSIQFKKGNVSIQINTIGATFDGKLDGDFIRGNFKQMGKTFPFVLSLDSSVIAPPNRPQEPKKPYPYIEKEVTFINPNGNIKLAGTLTYPKEGTNFKAVVLVTGSGPQDRNEELMEHKPFLVLSDYLTKHGIAVLRYDDRGVGKSEGNFQLSTLTDFIGDAKAAVTYLRTLPQMDTTHIGIIGHSEGGMIAEVLATHPNLVNFAILLAAPGIPIKDLMLQQTRDILTSNQEKPGSIDSTVRLFSKLYESILTKNCDISCLTNHIKEEVGEQEYNKNALQYLSLTQQLSTSYFSEFLQFNPQVYLNKIQIPVFALNGDKDIQVKADSNIDAIRKEMKSGNNANYTDKIYPNVNHLFQICQKCTVSEYGDIEMTFLPEALEDISNWIQNLK